MKKWFKFFSLSFFSDKISRDAVRRGYTNVVLGLIISFVFIWLGYIGAEMLPFGAHYNSSLDFKSTVRSLLANSDGDKRLCIEISDGVLKVKDDDGEYAEGLQINSLKNETDKNIYSQNGYNVVVDLRPADTPAEVVAYCLSNDGQELEISYEEYLSLSQVARLNFDFKLRYTGQALELTDKAVEGYRSYLNGVEGEVKSTVQTLTEDLAAGKITKAAYGREIYRLYFKSYYPDISDYESSSDIPLLRNYYYHEYIKTGDGKYLFIFDDYMAGSFETDGGILVSFYGFYDGLEDGVVVGEDMSQADAEKSADGFVKKSFASILLISLYAYAMNVFSFIPFIALMPMVVTLLAYSILKLRGIESITSFGAMFKIVGSYLWFSGVVAAILTVVLSFFVQRNMITALPLVMFFITLLIRSVIFTVREAKSYLKQLEIQSVQTEA